MAAPTRPDPAGQLGAPGPLIAVSSPPVGEPAGSAALRGTERTALCSEGPSRRRHDQATGLVPHLGGLTVAGQRRTHTGLRWVERHPVFGGARRKLRHPGPAVNTAH